MLAVAERRFHDHIQPPDHLSRSNEDAECKLGSTCRRGRAGGDRADDHHLRALEPRAITINPFPAHWFSRTASHRCSERWALPRATNGLQRLTRASRRPLVYSIEVGGAPAGLRSRRSTAAPTCRWPCRYRLRGGRRAVGVTESSAGSRQRLASTSRRSGTSRWARERRCGPN